MMKRLLTAAVAVMLTLSLAACGDNSSAKLPPISTGDTGALGTDFQKNMSQTTSDDIYCLCEGGDGYYFQKSSFVYFIDKQTKATTILCAKPDCLHSDNTCNAWINGQSLSYANNKLYYENGDSVLENGSYIDYGWRLYSMDADGTNRSVSQALEYTPGGDGSPYKTTPIIHRGNVYFTYKGVVYSVPLGEDIDNAVAIWGEETGDSNGAVVVVDPNSLQYTLWADGDYLYFMVNLKQSNGTYKDTLFAYHTVEREVTQVWQTPDASDVGEWETTGVSVSQWYVTDGFIYFYLSGGDMWRTSLETGKHEKLAETSRKTRYGTAVFSDQYMCLINTAPGNAIDLFSGNAAHTGGDTIFVYGLDGVLVKEISLQDLYEAISDIGLCQGVFISENEVYFMVNATTWNDFVNGIAAPNTNLILCCANIQTGDITQVCSWN